MKKDRNRTINLQKELGFDEIKTEEPKSLPVKTNIDEPKSENLTREEKYILRLIFQNKVYKADGQKFEDIFTEIMRYAEPEFQQIKPYGRMGDKKNDGYIKSKGIYFQVYGPENITNSISSAKKKLKEDFSGLLQEWKPVNEFYFIINDKYNGIPSKLEMEVDRLIVESRLKGGVKGAAYLENLLFSLKDDQILAITGLSPDPYKIKSLNYSILNEVIDYIMRIPLTEAVPSDILLPDWDKKIKFNNLSQIVARLLNSGSIQIASLDKYLMNQGNFLSEELKNKINKIYDSEKEHFTGDKLFFRIVSVASPRDETACQLAVIVIMAKYFETCDIFERPPEDYL